MQEYELRVWQELKKWQRKMERRPSLLGDWAKGAQTKLNDLVPEKVQQVVTTAIKQMVQAAVTGSQYTTTTKPVKHLSLEEQERLVRERLTFYKRTAAAEGAGTGAGGFVLGLADFPLLLGIKMKFLFETASIYGFDIADSKERLYILHIFQLAFSSDRRQKEVYRKILAWDQTVQEFGDLGSINWLIFQREYRDYIDLAKLLQLLPGIGAVVGALANYRLLNHLGETAMNAYRLRLFYSKGTVE